MKSNTMVVRYSVALSVLVYCGMFALAMWTGSDAITAVIVGIGGCLVCAFGLTVSNLRAP